MERLANQQAEQAAAAEAAKIAAAEEAKRQAAAKLAAEGPSPITKHDYVHGSRLKGSGMLVTPLKAGIKAEQDIKQITVDYALTLYNASEGRYPESHEEFMADIVEYNNIELEQLKEPYEHWYNAEVHELWKRVKPEAAAAAAEQAKVDTSKS